MLDISDLLSMARIALRTCSRWRRAKLYSAFALRMLAAAMLLQLLALGYLESGEDAKATGMDYV